MSLEFKAKNIDVPRETPFAHDKLERKPAVENLSLLLRNISSPIVLSVNAPWGTGKTTFLKMLNADLLNKECKSIYFSAWENDFASDPFLAFLGEMNQALESDLSGSVAKSAAWENAKKAGVHILKKGIPALVKAGTAGIVDVESILENVTPDLAEGLSKDLIDEYSKNKSAIASFKENVTKALENTEGEPTKLYIFVDELDRCRPTYSIELLERIKHLLDIEGLVFILALDKQQLAHSVRGIYGADFEATGYLRRFIDIEYNLGQVELDNFISQLFQTFNFQTFFDPRSQYSSFQYDKDNLINVFKMLAKSEQLSLREVEQLFSKVNLVVLSTNTDTHIHPELLVFLLVAKEFHANIYQNYIQKTSTPEQMIELLYSMFHDGERLESLMQECALIESFLIAAKNTYIGNYEGDSIKTHENILADVESTKTVKKYSQRVISLTQHLSQESGVGVNLSSLVKRIEMLEQFKFGEG